MIICVEVSLMVLISEVSLKCPSWFWIGIVVCILSLAFVLSSCVPLFAAGFKATVECEKLRESRGMSWLLCLCCACLCSFVGCVTVVVM